MQPIPAPGFQLISGKRNPPDGEGVKYWVQLRSGWVDNILPWPVNGPRWIWSSPDSKDCGDVVAVKKA